LLIEKYAPLYDIDEYPLLGHLFEWARQKQTEVQTKRPDHGSEPAITSFPLEDRNQMG
jgi:hypothetical protein